MAGVTTRKTPGVYITEIAAFPPSIVGVDTAVPAFIGYTQYAQVQGQPVYMQPVEIGSMAEFEQIFGGPFRPLYDINDVTNVPLQKDNYDFAVLNPASPPTMMYYKLVPAPAPAKQISSPPNSPPEGTVEFFAGAPVPAFPTLSRFNLYNSMLLYYANGGGRCYVVSVGDYTETVGLAKLQNGLTAIANQYGPTMLVVPDAILLPPSDEPWESEAFNTLVASMLAQCATLQDRVAILDVYGSASVTSGQTLIQKQAKLGTVIDKFREGVGDKFLDYGMAYFPFLYTTIAAGEINYQNISAGSFKTLQTILWWEAMNLYPEPTATLIKTNYIDTMEETDDEQAAVVKLNQNLVAAIPLLGNIENVILDLNSVLPPSGAMAGVFKSSDTARGVWNAPANLTLASVTQPTYVLNAEEQGDLNVPLDGKAVDAIRQFTGRGTVVWGARTLDGNSNDYRYIQVRRTLIYLEQSIKLALNQFVFAPNNGTTWTTVTAMVSSFLQGFWSSGGLLGATPAEAFGVTCGLGSTMTAQDILDGYMRVQVILQMVRPAEFIELTFKQKMEGAG